MFPTKSKLNEYNDYNYWKPRFGDGYPLDLDGSERITRFRQGVSPRPYPPLVGCVSGFMPQQDIRFWNTHFGKSPSGPNVTSIPVNLQWQITVPGLSKTG